LAGPNHIIHNLLGVDRLLDWAAPTGTVPADRRAVVDATPDEDASPSEPAQATGNRQQATGNRQQATGNEQKPH